MDQREVWTRIAASFSATRRAPWPHVVAFLESLPPGRVLDLMCGNGRHMAAAGRLGHDVVGLDWSVPLAREAAEHGRVVVGDATSLPFASGSFDACVFAAGLHGIPTAQGRAACVAELARVLRPGAPAQVTVWSRHAPRFAGAGPDVVVPWRAGGLDEGRTYHLYTPATLKAQLNGLDIVRVEEVAIASQQPDNVVAHVRTGAPLMRTSGLDPV